MIFFFRFQEITKKTVRNEVKEQIDRAFKNHAAVLEDSVLNAVKSRAVTPSPHLLDTHVSFFLWFFSVHAYYFVVATFNFSDAQFYFCYALFYLVFSSLFPS